MTPSLADRIAKAAQEASGVYHRLVLVVGPAQSGKTAALREVSEAQGWSLLNLNLRLAERLLELSKRQRAVAVPRVVDDLVRAFGPGAVGLDNIELLFDPGLAVDPLRLLQGLARDRTIVAAWPGTFDGAALTYATPGHPESRRYGQPEAVIVVTDRAAQSSHHQEQS